MLKICEIKTSVSSIEEAQTLAVGLLDARLVACVQIQGVGQSHYRWQGAIEHADEFYLLAKTSLQCRDEALAWLEVNHAYDVPEILCSEPLASDTYGRWVIAETSRTGVEND